MMTKNIAKEIDVIVARSIEKKTWDIKTEG